MHDVLLKRMPCEIAHRHETVTADRFVDSCGNIRNFYTRPNKVQSRIKRGLCSLCQFIVVPLHGHTGVRDIAVYMYTTVYLKNIFAVQQCLVIMHGRIVRRALVERKINRPGGLPALLAYERFYFLSQFQQRRSRLRYAHAVLARFLRDFSRFNIFLECSVIHSITLHVTFKWSIRTSVIFALKTKTYKLNIYFSRQ